MKHDIIKTDNYLLVVDGSEIMVDDFMYFWNGQSGSIHKHKEGYATENIYGAGVKIIAQLPLNNSPILQGVDLLPPLEQEDDVEKLANDLYPDLQYEQEIVEDRKLGFISGYNKAKERYKFTEEDMKKAFIKGTNYGAAYQSSIENEDWEAIKEMDENDDDTIKELIQSLSQPKMPIRFECEMEQYVIEQSMPENVIGYRCKTTPTPEGHTQWVGTYIYE